MKHITEDEKFGKVLSMNQTYAVRSFGVNSNDFILLATIHNVDLIRYYMGEILDVKGNFKMTEGQLVQNFLCTSESGALVSTTFMATPSWERRLEQIMITGVGGYSVLETGNVLKYHYNGPKLDIPRWQVNEEEEVVVGTMLTSNAGGAKDLYQNGFIGEISEFLKCVDTDIEPSQNNAFENFKTMELCDKIFAEMKEIK
jgi:predicted dehydrogenase